RLWDIRSGKQIQSFNEHTNGVNDVAYSPFVIDDDNVSGTSNVICSGSMDNTICFWDIRSNKDTLHMIKGNAKDWGIICLKFLKLKKNKKSNNDRICDINLCYGSLNGVINIWG
ncbi:ribosome assembly protein 4, partial [Reticulomyxa filosa]